MDEVLVEVRNNVAQPRPARVVEPWDRKDQPQVPEPTTAQRLGITPRFSDPIPLSAIDPNVPYLIVDEYNRILCPDNYGQSYWDYMFFGKFEDYAGYVLGTQFRVNPLAGYSSLHLGPPHSQVSLYAYGSSTKYEYLIYGQPGYAKSPIARMKAVNSSGDHFNLHYEIAGGNMYLCCDAGSWNWAYVGNTTYRRVPLTARKFYLRKADLFTLFRETWPSAHIDEMSFRNLDDEYELVHSAKASQIYNNSGLSNFRYVKELFDCDDFGYVMKAAASKQAYDDNRAEGGAVVRPYALGFVWGISGPYSHVANVFVDYTGTVKILEPQSGKIVDGKDWQYDSNHKYKPYFICL